MNLFDLLEINVRDLIAAFMERKRKRHAQFAPSDRQLELDRRGKVVRLDVAIMACHLMAARVAFKHFGGILFQLARIAESQAKGYVVGSLITNSAEGARLAKRGANVLGSIAGTLDAVRLQGDKEVKIRKAGFTARDEVFNNRLMPGKGRRKRKIVRTRHKSRKQRAPNKLWHSPKSKK